MNRFFWLGVAAFLCGANGNLAHAQDSILAELYGQGVHSYFAGDLNGAKELLTTAISQGSKDPRAYFFRGLTYDRLGNEKQAEADYQMGAKLEALGTDRIYPVSDSLQRVQGRTRLHIEKERQAARLASRMMHNKAEQARYQQMEKSAGPATRRAPAAGPNAIAPAVPGTPDKSDPFVDDMEVKPEPAPARPRDVAAEPKPEAADPFGAVTPTSPAPAAAEKPAEAPAADPFGAPAATPPATNTADPFSTEQPAEAPPASAPAEKPIDDPFGS